MNFDELTDEQRTKAMAAKTPEQIMALAEEEGYELSDEELEAVSGGSWDCFDHGCSVRFGR
ncbi:MAG: Nif11 family protein [Coriobacteriaceae bacterium]|nr:Nif11 family protein [Coriobacteriaceae bacterium]